ncbi:MAG TPA: AAA family ATPase [Planktothrix sp.]|jgi:pantothenate kinase
MEKPETIASLASELLSQLKSNGDHSRLMLGIVGYPGAGKSTIAEALVKEINHQNSTAISCVVPMDGYHYSNEQLDEMQLLHLKGIPDTFDSKSFVELLRKLKTNNGLVCAPLFDRGIEASIPDAIEILQSHRVLVVEGNYLLLQREPWIKIKELLDEVWFIDTTFDIIMPRLLERHKIGGRSEEATREKIASTDMPNAKLIDSTKEHADRLIKVSL